MDIENVSFGDVAAMFFYLVVIYVLVRPRSAGPDMIISFSRAFASMVETVTGVTVKEKYL